MKWLGWLEWLVTNGRFVWVWSVALLLLILFEDTTANTYLLFMILLILMDK